MSDAYLAPPNLDVAAAYPEIGPFQDALTRWAWDSARDLYVGADWASRSFLADRAGRLGVEPFLRTILAQRPTDTVAAVLLGAYLIREGWNARTSYRAEHVSATQFTTFHQYLNKAEQVLIDVTAREPGNVTAWTLRLDTARGLELGQSEAARRYGHLARHDPHHVAAQRKMLQQLCPKWGGTFPEAHAFARNCLVTSVEGAHNGVLLVDMHLERWLEHGDPYLRSPAVQAEIREAAGRSVWHPRFVRSNGWVQVHNTFAAAFSLLGDLTAAASSFRAVGGLVSEYPWDYFGDPARQFAKHRARALAAS